MSLTKCNITSGRKFEWITDVLISENYEERRISPSRLQDETESQERKVGTPVVLWFHEPAVLVGGGGVGVFYKDNNDDRGRSAFSRLPWSQMKSGHQTQSYLLMSQIEGPVANCRKWCHPRSCHP